MDTFYERLQTVLTLDDDSLRDLVGRAFDALNVPEHKRAKIIKDLPLYRARAKELSPEELEALIGSIGKERVFEILKSLEGAQDG